MTFKFNHELLGGHVHIAVFSGKDRDHLGKCGDLVMREEEWSFFAHHLTMRNNQFPDQKLFIFEDLADRRPPLTEDPGPGRPLYPYRGRV